MLIYHTSPYWYIGKKLMLAIKFSDSLLSTILNQYYCINLKSVIFTFDFCFQYALFEKKKKAI